MATIAETMAATVFGRHGVAVCAQQPELAATGPATAVASEADAAGNAQPRECDANVDST